MGRLAGTGDDNAAAGEQQQLVGKSRRHASDGVDDRRNGQRTDNVTSAI